MSHRACIIAGITLSAALLASCASGSKPSPGASGSGSPAASTAAPNALGPSACVTASKASSQAGPFKLVSPHTLCGLPQNNSQAEQSAGGEMVSAVEGDLQNVNGGPNYGQQTSWVSQGYQIPQNAAGVYRSISFTGLMGTFNPQAAASAVESSVASGYTFTSVPPGPNGGVMACGALNSTSENCVWSTPTTLGLIMIIDTTKQLTGTNIAANALRIRDVLEVPI
jgi:hypothetical protein